MYDRLRDIKQQNRELYSRLLDALLSVSLRQTLRDNKERAEQKAKYLYMYKRKQTEDKRVAAKKKKGKVDEYPYFETTEALMAALEGKKKTVEILTRHCQKIKYMLETDSEFKSMEKNLKTKIKSRCSRKSGRQRRLWQNGLHRTRAPLSVSRAAASACTQILC